MISNNSEVKHNERHGLVLITNFPLFKPETVLTTAPLPLFVQTPSLLPLVISIVAISSEINLISGIADVPPTLPTNNGVDAV